MGAFGRVRSPPHLAYSAKVSNYARYTARKKFSVCGSEGMHMWGFSIALDGSLARLGEEDAKHAFLTAHDTVKHPVHISLYAACVE